MAIKSSDETELKSIDNITKSQLPNKFKAIGFGIFIISFVLNCSLPFVLENYEYNGFIDKAVKSLCLLGLLVVSISKEKIEDELIIALRMKSYNYAFIGCVVMTLIMSSLNYFIVYINSNKTKIEGISDFTILGMLLTIQIFSFRSLKRSHNEK